MSNGDTSERDLTEAALRESAQRMRAIWETVIDGIIVIDERGLIESLNPAACRIFGYAPSDVVGRNVSMLMPSPHREGHDGYLANYLLTGEAKIIGIGREVTGQRQDGTTFPMDLSVEEVRLGERRLFTGVVRDITERKRAEDALRESEHRMRAILDTAVEGIITIDERGRVESVNPAASRIFGYPPEEVIGRNVSMLMPSPYREEHDGYLANFQRTGEAKIIGIGREVTGRRKDGSIFPMELSVGEVPLGGRRLFTGMVRDISERRALELAVTAAAEAERARIARELHDGLAQQLGGLLFLMNGLRRDLESEQSAQVSTADQLCDELATALGQARNLAHELYAVPARPEGLSHALEILADRITHEPEIVCVVSGNADLLVYDQAVASHLYRIAQEAVQNALKHSGASRIDIVISELPTSLQLSVRDNGAGIAASSSRGLGLHNMEQRARLVGGKLTIRAQPEGGTEVICIAPNEPAENTGQDRVPR